MRKLPNPAQMRAYIRRHDRVLYQGEYYYGKKLSFHQPYDKDLADGIGELIEVFSRRYGYSYRVDIDMNDIFLMAEIDQSAILNNDLKCLSDADLSELYHLILAFDGLIRDIERFYCYYLGCYEISG